MTTLNQDFLWGNSTSSMQTEGAWNVDGKGPSVYDIKEAGEHNADWKVAIDEYHRYPEDVEWMAKMHMNCYRFQISWSRVCPEGDGAFNEAGIAFYDRLIDDLLAHGIEPMICLYHFDMPLSLAKRYNGFVSREVMEAFVRYGKEMLKRFAGKVKYWITFNEHNCFTYNPGLDSGGNLTAPRDIHTLYALSHHTLLAHAKLTAFIRSHYPDVKIGGMLAYAEVYPASSDPEDVEVTRRIDEFVNNNYLDVFAHGHYSPEVLHFMAEADLMSLIEPGDLETLAQTTSDFIAFSYYASSAIDHTKIDQQAPVNWWFEQGTVPNPHLVSSEWGWQIDPTGFKNALTKIWNQTGLPVFPIENGLGVREQWDGEHPIDDTYRINYHRDHIQALKAAVRDYGVPVLGYLGWGLIDIPSSKGDIDKRYGAVYVNRTNHELRDLRRIPKRSFEWFQKAFGSNGEDLS